MPITSRLHTYFGMLIVNSLAIWSVISSYALVCLFVLLTIRIIIFFPLFWWRHKQLQFRQVLRNSRTSKVKDEITLICMKSKALNTRSVLRQCIGTVKRHRTWTGNWNKLRWWYLEGYYLIHFVKDNLRGLYVFKLRLNLKLLFFLSNSNLILPKRL